MPATNQTPNYELPIFIGTDKPSWMGDWNGAMNKIDAALGEVKGLVQAAQTTANAASTTAQAAQTSVGAMETKVTALETEQTSLQQSLMSVNEAMQDLQQQVNNLPTGLNFTPIKIKDLDENLLSVSVLTNGAYCAAFTIPWLGTTTRTVITNAAPYTVEIGAIQGNPFGLSGYSSPQSIRYYKAGFGRKTVAGSTGGSNYDFEIFLAYDSTNDITRIILRNASSAISLSQKVWMELLISISTKGTYFLTPNSGYQDSPPVYTF